MDNEHNDRNTPIKLEPLTPQYLEEEHEVYVSALLDAIEDENVHNIALSGGYGIGKSSILRQFASLLKGRCIEVSLSTLAPVNSWNPENEAVTSGETTTNKIQREVVKQLLYRESAQKMPLSRFRRIEAFSPEWAWQISFVTGSIIAIAFALTGWAEMLSEKLLGGRVSIPTMTLLVLFGAAFIVFAAQSLLNGKLNIKEVAAGPATVSLNEDDGTYFDKYLDEIVYFFEIADYDIIIFEDIDRFEDPTIFESLKELNAILNLSPCISRPIRFIYAVKDSIFDHGELKRHGRRVDSDSGEILDRAKAESVRSNRTKFFDVIVPVVPFITHASARDHLTRMMSEIDHDVDDNLIDLASQHVPDMRMLKNVRNEFLIFRAQIMSHGGSELELSESHVFAMMLYKSTHLSDFEKIRLGASDLDDLYRVSRQAVEWNINQLSAGVVKLKNEIGQMRELDSRSNQLSSKLEAYVECVLEAVGCDENLADGTFEFDGQVGVDIATVKFWRKFIDMPESGPLVWRSPDGEPFSFTKDNVERGIGVRFNVESWRASDDDKLERQITSTNDDINALRAADFAELMDRSEWVISETKTTRSFDSYVRELMGPGLAYELIKSGYITKNYVLYSSLFHAERMTCNAMSFVIHHIDRNVMGVQYALNDDEVRSIISYCGSRRLNESAMYNIRVLNWLIENDSEAADQMIASLEEGGADQVHFLQSYMNGGSSPDYLVKRLTVLTVSVLEFLVLRLDLSDESRSYYVNLVLSNLTESDQMLADGVCEYLQIHYSEFQVLTSQSSEQIVRRVANLFERAGVILSSLNVVSRSFISEFVKRNLYEINADNLKVIVGGEVDSLALDVIRGESEFAYEYVVSHLSRYLGVVDECSETIARGNSFIPIIEDLLARGSDGVDVVIRNASPVCSVSDISQIRKSSWKYLALYERFEPTWNNVTRYVDEFDIDEEITVLLSASQAIIGLEGIKEVDKARFAYHLLNTVEESLSVEVRAMLVNSLHLKDLLDVSEFEPYSGRLLVLLMRGGSIGDCLDSYRRLFLLDWPSRRDYILASSKFVEFMTPEVVGGDLLSILQDSDVSPEICKRILQDVESYRSWFDSEVLTALGKRARALGASVPLSVVCDMAYAQVDVVLVLTLLVPHLDAVTHSELARILCYIGGDYIYLAERGQSPLKFEKFDALVPLLERLKQLNIVSSWNMDGDLIKVYRKHPKM
jgi:hypothetical protein